MRVVDEWPIHDEWLKIMIFMGDERIVHEWLVIDEQILVGWYWLIAVVG